MTNLLLTVSILVTTNWTEVTTPGNNKEWPQILEVGRLQTNYIISTTKPIHPAFRTEPDYGPWEFARDIQVPFNIRTNILRTIPLTNAFFRTDHYVPAAEVAPPPPGRFIRDPVTIHLDQTNHSWPRPEYRPRRQPSPPDRSDLGPYMQSPGPR